MAKQAAWQCQVLEEGHCGCHLSIRLPTPWQPPPSVHLSADSRTPGGFSVHTLALPQSLLHRVGAVHGLFEDLYQSPLPCDSQGCFLKEPLLPTRSEVPVGRFTLSQHTTVSCTAVLLPAPSRRKEGNTPLPEPGSGQPGGVGVLAKGGLFGCRDSTLKPPMHSLPCGTLSKGSPSFPGLPTYRGPGRAHTHVHTHCRLNTSQTFFL